MTDELCGFRLAADVAGAGAGAASAVGAGAGAGAGAHGIGVAGEGAAMKWKRKSQQLYALNRSLSSHVLLLSLCLYLSLSFIIYPSLYVYCY